MNVEEIIQIFKCTPLLPFFRIVNISRLCERITAIFILDDNSFDFENMIT